MSAPPAEALKSTHSFRDRVNLGECTEFRIISLREYAIHPFREFLVLLVLAVVLRIYNEDLYFLVFSRSVSEKLTSGSGLGALDRGILWIFV